ncbi:MAG TPA: hypothetical protein VHH57_08420 [Gaiella sp.]|nr:hypothetical protein [Gaiella sp.]
MRQLPRVASLSPLRLPCGPGVLHGWVLPVAGVVPGVRRLLLSVQIARFE